MRGSTGIRVPAIFLPILLLMLIAPLSEGATRLTYEIDGEPKMIAWGSQSLPIEFMVDRDGIGSGNAFLLNATSVWADGSEGTVSFTISEGSGSKAGQDGRNVITVQDELLSRNGVLAFTTSWFDDDGRIFESDIQIDRSQLSNLGALLTHELGHSLGFDHSPLLSSVMYPYVPEKGRLRLDLDDRLALRAAYPPLQAGGSIAGTVESNRGPVWGAQVVAVDEEGQPVASSLTDSQGKFLLESLPRGAYEIYAEPLDGPVSPNNFSGVWRRVPAESFPTAFMGSARINLGETDRREGVRIAVSDQPTSLNPKWIGRIDPGANELVLDSIAVEVSAGERFSLAVGGDGFVSGMTEFTVSGNEVKRRSDFTYGSNYVWAEFEVLPQASPRSIVIMVDSGNERATLTGGLRIAEGNEPRRRSTRRR